jgi:hypothetical protein
MNTPVETGGNGGGGGGGNGGGDGGGNGGGDGDENGGGGDEIDWTDLLSGGDDDTTPEDIDPDGTQPDPDTPGGTNPAAPPVPNVPGNQLTPTIIDGVLVFIEIGDDGVPLGEWRWDDEELMWIFDPYPPLGNLVLTGATDVRIYWALLLLSLMGMIAALRRRASYKAKHQE